MVVWVISGLSKCVFFSRKPRGVRSNRIRQKERLVRYETPPSAAGGGTPGENMSTKAEDETRDSGSSSSQARGASRSTELYFIYTNIQALFKHALAPLSESTLLTLTWSGSRCWTGPGDRTASRRQRCGRGDAESGCTLLRAPRGRRSAESPPVCRLPSSPPRPAAVLISGVTRIRMASCPPRTHRLPGLIFPTHRSGPLPPRGGQSGLTVCPVTCAPPGRHSTGVRRRRQLGGGGSTRVRVSRSVFKQFDE